MDVRDKLYIDGAWVPSTGRHARGLRLGHRGGHRHDSRGDAPRTSTGRSRPRPRAFPGWSATSREERAKLLDRVAEGLAARDRRDRHVDLARRSGMPLHALRISSRSACPSMSFADAAQRGRASSPGKRRSATPSSSASPSASSAPSRRGTTRCTRSPSRWRRRWPRAARSCSSRARWRRSTPSSWPRSSTRSGFPPGVFNLVTGVGPGRRRGHRRRTRSSTWCRSPARPGPGKRVMELAPQTREAGGARARRQVAPTSSSRTPTSPRPCRPACSAATSTPARPARRSPGCSCRARRLAEVEELAARRRPGFTPGDPFDGDARLGPLVSADAARPGARLHQEGHRRGRQARHRWRRAARGPRQGLLRAADRLLRRHAAT